MIAFAAGIAACKSPASKQAVANIVTARFEQMNRHDTNAIAALFADTAKISSPNWDGVKTGPAGVREVYRRYFASSPDIHYTITRITVNECCHSGIHLHRHTFTTGKQYACLYAGKKIHIIAVHEDGYP